MIVYEVLRGREQEWDIRDSMGLYLTQERAVKAIDEITSSERYSGYTVSKVTYFGGTQTYWVLVDDYFRRWWWIEEREVLD